MKCWESCKSFKICQMFIPFSWSLDSEKSSNANLYREIDKEGFVLNQNRSHHWWSWRLFFFGWPSCFAIFWTQRCSRHVEIEGTTFKLANCCSWKKPLGPRSWCFLPLNRHFRHPGCLNSRVTCRAASGGTAQTIDIRRWWPWDADLYASKRLRFL